MSEILGPASGYVEIVNLLTQELIDERAGGEKKYSPLRPSAAGKCERELGYEQMEYKGHAKYRKENFTPETHRLLNFGYHVENHVIREFETAFKRMAKPIEIKYKQHTLSFFKLPDGTRVEGNIDLVLWSEKYKCVADIKSKKDKWSSYYKTSWDELTGKLSTMQTVHKFGEDSYWVTNLDGFIKELDDPFFAANFYQLNMYFFDEHHFLREKGVDHACIFQLNKNDSRIREIRFRPSETLYQETKDKFTRVQQVIDETKDPENLKKDYVLGSAKCGFCSFREQCWPEENAMKEHFATWPKKRWPKDLDRFPEAVQEELDVLIKIFEGSQKASEEVGRIEAEILKILENHKVNKIRFSEDQIYEVKRLKSGGVRGGPRLVLRRSKV